MSDDGDPGFLKKRILPWFHTPNTYTIGENGGWEEEKFGEKDDIWSDMHIFQGDWQHIQGRVDWYESPNITQIYEDHVYIFKQNMDMGRPDERFYYENVDSGAFESVIRKEGDLPSGRGKYCITSNLGTKTPPSGENDFGMIEYYVETDMRYDMPDGVTFLPRLLAYPLNRFFKGVFLLFVGHHLLDYDGEFAREKTTEYFQYLRKYHGEEPTQTKTRQAEFEPVPEEGFFFQ
jgi:hypothetical protein